MTEVTEHTVFDGADGPVQSGADETSLVEVFDNFLEISQNAELAQRAASDEITSSERSEQEDRQHHGQTVCSPAAETSSTQSMWAVGAQCQAVWSEDGQVYLATVVAVDGERCRVRFNGYNNEEDMELSALMSPNTDLQTQSQNMQDWKPGSRCRAVYSEDGLVYPAVVLWVKGQRCCVRFDEYNNEEEQDVCSLLSPNELHGPGKSTTKGSSETSSSFDWRRRREESQGGRGGVRRAQRHDEQNLPWAKERGGHSKVEREAEKKKEEAAKPSSDSFPLFPPFTPPAQLGSAFFIPPPPPPPLWMCGGKEPSDSSGIDDVSSMLMLWYMCGFHTGSYMAQQRFRSTPKD
ncbi:survival motor neuron protein-like isoform X2 [Mastacembelus armatus]|uniref:Survival motor neuron protein-like n=1 Tax=Mastacembelus armatus TaxID=205130 RepID=A0A3Q3M9P0_9TELE|nr:survival motor neuron protein-like isoform X2 [Mastacembelus armatus]